MGVGLMSEELVGKFVVGAIVGGLLGVLAIVILSVRKLWGRVTDPESARRLGSRVRASIDGAAKIAGQASGTAESVAKSAARSFSDGRKSSKETLSED